MNRNFGGIFLTAILVFGMAVGAVTRRPGGGEGQISWVL